MSAKAWLYLCCVAFSGWAPNVHAQAATAPLRVLLLGTPAELERALRTALSPWGMHVDPADAEDYEALPRSTTEAGALARRLDADALVWLSDGVGGPELWLYDVAKAESSARSVPTPPFGATLSAALALSVKTQLRTYETAAPGPASAPEAAATGASPENGDPPSVALDNANPAPPVGDPPYPPNWQILIHAGARGAATTPAVTEFRYALEARWAPWRGSPGGPRLWFAARMDVGLAQAIVSPVFRGEYSELGGGVGVGVQQRLSQLFGVGVQLGASLYSASLSGTLLVNPLPAQQSHFGAALHLRPELELSLGPVGVLLQPALGASLRPHSYVDGENEVLETSRFWWLLGGGVRVNVQ